MDISKLPIKAPKRAQITRPLEIFKSLTLRGSVQNVWGPQAEALQAWHDDRKLQDVVIGMNTGGGKTLVGLIIAQSLINETRGKVLYVCPTKQLVEQTAEKARECGLDVATYMAGTWVNEQAYDRCLGCCITNYAAVFNSKSIFRDHHLAGILFDDAHVAGGFVRSQFTLDIPIRHPAFKDLANLFRAYFYRSSQAQQFEDAINGDRMPLLFVPMFEVHRQADTMRRILSDAGVDAAAKTRFPWEYLKDLLSRCVVLLSGTSIQIAPPILPLQTLQYFHPSCRRVYLTATLPTQVDFLRTFGVATPKTIMPGGKSGDAQRLCLFVVGDTENDLRETVLNLIETHKACIVTSSERLASAWCPPAVKFEGTHAAIQAFSASRGTDKLALAARFDGVDLPGDACRVLVLEGLPTGSTLFESFIDNGLRIERLRTSHVATRIAQSIGRIFRSNTDHGVVLLCGHDIRRWLSDPHNQECLPGLLQQQVNFGLELSKLVQEGQTSYEDLIAGVLKGTKEWDQLYSEHVPAFEAAQKSAEPEWFTKAVLGEVRAYAQLWRGQFGDAASRYGTLADEVESQDPRFAAWLRHWEGLAQDLLRNTDAATRAYVRAANQRSELGRPATRGGAVIGTESLVPSAQARSIAVVLKSKGHKLAAALGAVADGLRDGSRPAVVEQALRDLGMFLGLESSRPDNDTGSGPDVLWKHDSSPHGAAIEAKTDKKVTSQYTKGDIGQFHDHIAWLQKQYVGEAFMKIVVGPKLQLSKETNPPDDLRVVALEQFMGLAERLKQLYDVAAAMPSEDERVVSIERNLRDLGLSWPRCIESLESCLVGDLKAEPIADQVN